MNWKLESLKFWNIWIIETFGGDLALRLRNYTYNIDFNLCSWCMFFVKVPSLPWGFSLQCSTISNCRVCGWHWPFGPPSKTRSELLLGPLFFGRNGLLWRLESPILKHGFLERRLFFWFGPPFWCQKNIKVWICINQIKHPMRRPNMHVV